MCEVAQINSECLSRSVEKHASGSFGVDMTYLRSCFMYETDSESFFDREDLYRTEYFFRKHSTPLNLYWTAREGLVDDYFDSWDSEEGDKGRYNPHENLQIIFSFM